MRSRSRPRLPAGAASRRLGAFAALALLCAWPAISAAQASGNATLPLLIGQGAGGTSYSVPIQTLLFFTALSFLPAVLLLMTGFTRIVIVLSLLRQALGTQAAPPNQVIVGLSLFLTFFVMSPTIDKVYAPAIGTIRTHFLGAGTAAGYVLSNAEIRSPVMSSAALK